MTTPSATQLGRMRKLLTQAEEFADRGHESEAALARERVFELMAKYDVSEEYLKAIEAAPDELKETKVFEVRKPFIQKGRLMHVLSQMCHVKVVMGSKPKTTVQKVHAFGFKQDMARFEMLWLSVLAQGERLYALEKIPPGTHPPTFKRGWWESLTVAVFQQITAEKQKAHSVATPGAELVLRDRDAQVQDFVDEAFGATRKGRKSGTRTHHGNREGYAAGKKINLKDSAVDAGVNRRALS